MPAYPWEVEVGCWEIQGAPSGLGCKVLRSHGRQAAQAFLFLPTPPSSSRFLSLPSQCSSWYFFIPLSLPLICPHPQTRKKPRQCLTLWRTHQIRSDQISCSVVSDSLRPHESQHARPPCPEFTETHIHRVSDAIQPSHPLSSPSPLAPNPSQHQSLFQ